MTQKGIVVAVGGNALIRDKKQISTDSQSECIKESAGYIAALVEQGYTPVVTHGNGPQVGFMLRRAELAESELPGIPLDVLGADTQGATGYLFSRNLHSEFSQRGITRDVAALVTQSIVDPADPQFKDPSKPIGTFMDEDEAKFHEEHDHWILREDSGRGYRRVVPSPRPLEIIEAPVIKTLVESGVVVVAAGGGGIPVKRQGTEIKGVEAVIDKDLGSSLLATQLGVEEFIICTAVEFVSINFNTPEQQDLRELTVADAKKYLSEGQFGKGSMAPKVEAAIEFLEHGGKSVIITSLGALPEALQGHTGTRIVA